MATPATQINTEQIDETCIDTIRTLAIDAVQKANSGHPGAPMALAPVAYTLWQQFLRYDPADPTWPNRDRFILSNGHASMLLYAMIHLAGIRKLDENDQVTDEPALSLTDLENFRQLDSPTPGHPEFRYTTGVEATTGPLGQGVATSVGMAIASKWQAAHFNRTDRELFDFDVYVICSDGDLMEGVSHEAASIAGHQRLGNLCWLYDNNHITIDGHTDLAYEDRVNLRFEGYGWNVTTISDANDTEQIAHALENFRSETERPTMIIVDSHIGYGSPNKVDTEAAHGEPLGEEEVIETKRAYGWPEDAQFLVPDGVRERFDDGIGKRGAEASAAWHELFEAYSADEPEMAAQLNAMQVNGLPEGWDADLPSFEAGDKGLATRKASNKVQNAIAAKVPWLLSGSADLTNSTSVGIDDSPAFEPGDRAGRQFHYGIREHESAAISSGLSLSNLRPMWSTYLTFSDYARPAIRLSALMELPVIHVFTHDSIGLGEDGPTHQPIEQLASLRAIPGLDVIRPGDANEVSEAWRLAMDRTIHPVALILTRQDVPIIDRSKYASAEGARRGGYVLADPSSGDPDVILIATGSEVSLALEAHEELAGEGIASRVVSLPCWEVFDRQDQAYRDEVLPPAVTARVSVEQASTMGWYRYVGEEGEAIGMHTFGTSAPFADAEKKFGFSPDKVAETAKEVIDR